MCNLYRMKGSVAEVAALFGTDPAQQPAAETLNVAAELYPGYRGLVVVEGTLRAMNWGVPVILTGKQGQKLKPKPVTNARDDKLSSPFWRDSFTRCRCLIPATQWAEPEGEPRRMTRTWYAPSDRPAPKDETPPLFAIAGLWRPTAEWGDSYAMVMCPASEQMSDVHDRMPVILPQEAWATWTDGTPKDAFDLYRTWPGELVVERTRENWVTGHTG